MRSLLLVFLPLAVQMPAVAARLEVIQWESRVLKNNPLQDSALRQVAVLRPSDAGQGERLPVVYYLPGYGGSPANVIANSNLWLKLTEELAKGTTPMTLVVVDGRTRWGCSQYLNSPAQGNYADYICNEIVPTVEARFPAPTNGTRRIIAGFSSGGFGALRLGMAYHKLFDGVIALSPDSDFPVSHLRLVRLPGVTNASLAEIESIESERVRPPKNGDLLYALGLSAAYASRGPSYPGQFDWLYDKHGRFRWRVWQRWLANDPLTIARDNPHAFAPDQAIYLDGAAQDQYSANIGARKIYEAIRSHVRRCAFYEPPGKHDADVPARLERGLEWMFGKVDFTSHAPSPN